MDAISLMNWLPAGARTPAMPGTPIQDRTCALAKTTRRVRRTISFSSEDESSTQSCSEATNKPQGRWNSMANLRKTHLLAKYLPVSLPTLSFNEYRPGVKRKAGSKSQLRVYEEIPDWLKNNKFIRDGYLVNCNARDCFYSLVQWHNETVNIWTHLTGFFILLAILCYDVCHRLPRIGASPQDTMACVLVTATYTFTLLLSSVYHTFKCMHEHAYYALLKADVVGIGLSLSATIMSGTYYAFHDDPFWQRVYLSIEFVIVSTIYVTTFHPKMASPVYEHRRNVAIAFYVIFALVPTTHWALVDGLDSGRVRLVLPRVIIVFTYAGLAFVVFGRRFPECLYPGSVDYLGASHQIWHVFVVLAKISWHETGFRFLRCHVQSSCDDAALADGADFW